MKQVDKTAYQFGSYTNSERWGSYFYQLREILSKKPDSVLEIGVGEGVIREYLNAHTSIRYHSLDFADDLKPDTVGEITNIPFKDAEFDAICAFEVLEHLPFESFEKAVSEMFRVARRYVLISLPHFGPPFLIDIKIPLLPRIRFAFKLPFPSKHVFNGQHYWEIGKKGYPASRIRSVLRNYGTIVSEFVPFENQYHHFFVLRK